MKLINSLEKPIAALSLSLILFGCANKNTSESKSDIAILHEIDVTRADDKALISAVIDTVEYLPLNGSIEHPIGRVDDMQITNKGFFMLDQRRNIIYVYSSDGRWLYDLAAMGNGKGEYNEIACFTVTDREIWIVDNFTKTILKYSLDNGSFIESLKTPFPISGIRVLDNGDLLLAQDSGRGAVVSGEFQKNRLYIAAPDMTIKKEFLSFGENRDIIMMPQALKDGDGTIIYASQGFGGYTVIDATDGNLIGNVAIKTSNPYDESKLGDKNISGSEAMNIADREGMQLITSTPICSSRFSVFTVKDGNRGLTYLWDNSTGTVYQNPTESYHNMLIVPHGVNDDKFYHVHFYGFIDELLEHGFNKPDAVSDSILHNEGSAILIYTMK